MGQDLTERRVLPSSWEHCGVDRLHLLDGASSNLQYTCTHTGVRQSQGISEYTQHQRHDLDSRCASAAATTTTQSNGKGVWTKTSRHQRQASCTSKQLKSRVAIGKARAGGSVRYAGQAAEICSRLCFWLRRRTSQVFVCLCLCSILLSYHSDSHNESCRIPPFCLLVFARPQTYASHRRFHTHTHSNTFAISDSNSIAHHRATPRRPRQFMYSSRSKKLAVPPPPKLQPFRIHQRPCSTQLTND